MDALRTPHDKVKKPDPMPKPEEYRPLPGDPTDDDDDDDLGRFAVRRR